MFSIFKPKHTTEMVINQLIKGLKLGDIVIPNPNEESNDESQNIKNIISAIKDIAEQTYKLANDASLEAEKSREKKAGFLVIADGVRFLAERSKESSSVISNRVYSIEKNIKTNHIDLASQDYHAALNSIHTVSDIVVKLAEKISKSDLEPHVVVKRLEADIRSIELKSNDAESNLVKLATNLNIVKI